MMRMACGEVADQGRTDFRAPPEPSGSKVSLLLMVLTFIAVLTNLRPANGAEDCISIGGRKENSDKPNVDEIALAEKSYARYTKHYCELPLSPARFDLRFGAERDVCRSYIKYLSAQRYELKAGRGPSCVRWFIPTLEGITRPDVIVLPRGEKQRLLNYVDRPSYAALPRQKPPALMPEDRVDKYAMWLIPHGIDLDRDGTDDPIYVVATGYCSEKNLLGGQSYRVLPYIWDARTNERNESLQKVIAGQAVDESADQSSVDIFHGFFEADVFSFFMFQGLAYFDVSSTASNLKVPIEQLPAANRRRFESIDVFEVENQSRKKVCEVRILKD